MIYALLALAVALSLSYNSLTRAARVPGDIPTRLRFNIAVSVSAALVAALFGGRPALPSSATLFWGALYGLASACNLFTRMKALETGPMTATLLIGCSSMVVTTLFGATLWHESVTGGQVLGVALMLAAMALSMRPGGLGAATKFWPLYALGLLLTNALIGLIFKAHQSTPWAGESHLMVSAGFVVSALLIALASGTLAGARGKPRLDRRTYLMAAACGAALSVCNLLNTRLSGALPSVVFFPIYNGAVLVLSAPVAFALFRERIAGRQLASVALAVAAIALIGGAISF